jgi:hypothetical protein
LFAQQSQGAAENSAKRAICEAERVFDRPVIHFFEITKDERGAM